MYGHLFHHENIQILKAGIGPIGKSDIGSAKANLEINPLDSIVLGFNVEKEADVVHGDVKIITNDVVYKLIEDLQEEVSDIVDDFIENEI
jgi:translation initiation factor IF-2